MKRTKILPCIAVLVAIAPLAVEAQTASPTKTVPTLNISGVATTPNGATTQPVRQKTPKVVEVEVDAPEVEADTENAPKRVKKSAVATFQKAQEAYKKAIQEVKKLQKQYVALSTTEEQKEEIGENLEKYAEYVSKMYPKLLDLAEKAWLEAPSRDPEMLRFIVEVLEIRLVTEEYERAQKILDGLFAQNIPEILPEIYDVAGETAFMLNQFEQAGRYFALAEQNKTLSERSTAFKNDLPYYRAAWGKEEILRQREKKENNLPRVRLETTKGPIVLELYENEAPNTVANFVYLVEKGFYDGLYFDSVIPGFCAESGRSMENPDGGPGYAIRDEYDTANARNHYRGTLSMSNSGPNTAGSRFFISLTPMRELDGKFVVFGRVIEGMEVLSELQRIDPANPDPMAEMDQIERASVIRKRDHKYRPKVLKLETEDDSATEEDSSKSKKSSKNKKKTGKSAY